MKSQADESRRDLNFQEGDWVMVKLQPYKQHSLAQRLNGKLGKRYYGPFLVLQKIGKVAYKLDLPSTSQIHPVFHVSHLKPFVGSEVPPRGVTLLNYNEDSQNLIFPLAIVDRRTILVDNQLKSQVLVQWDGSPVEDSSWEDVDVLHEIFPHLNLED